MSGLLEFIDSHGIRLIIARREGIWDAYLYGVDVDGDPYPSARGSTPDEALAALSAFLEGKTITREVEKTTKDRLQLGVFAAAGGAQ